MSQYNDETIEKLMADINDLHDIIENPYQGLRERIEKLESKIERL